MNKGQNTCITIMYIWISEQQESCVYITDFQVKSYDKDFSIKFINGSQSLQIKKKLQKNKIKENINIVYIFFCNWLHVLWFEILKWIYE